MFLDQRRERSRERGSALIYILIAIALLAALTFTFMEPSSQQTSSQNTFKAAASIQGHVDIIRSTIQECVLTYPRGDTSIDTSGSGTDPGALHYYPIDPNSEYYDGSTLDRAGNNQVRNLRCPGNGSGNDHAPIFGGNTGKFLPPAPDLFGEWQYYNGADGVFFWIESDKSDAFISTALQKLDDSYSECEADVIDATGGAEDLDSAATPLYQCSNGSVCFRVWMIMNGDTAHFDGDADGDEDDCSSVDTD